MGSIMGSSRMRACRVRIARSFKPNGAQENPGRGRLLSIRVAAGTVAIRSAFSAPESPHPGGEQWSSHDVAIGAHWLITVPGGSVSGHWQQCSPSLWQQKPGPWSSGALQGTYGGLAHLKHLPD